MAVMPNTDFQACENSMFAYIFNKSLSSFPFFLQNIKKWGVTQDFCTVLYFKPNNA